MPKIIEYNTETVEDLFSAHTIYENREKIARFSSKEYKSDVTICITMYKDPEKVKRCVESVLKYSQGIDFDLIILIDGPRDNLLDYCKTIEYEKTTIIYNTANRGASVPWTFLSIDMFSEYVAAVTGDSVVTENWLTNLLTCIKSDPKIGVVVPMSSNVSNLQEDNLGGFSDYDEMQKKAALFNVSDPRKWEERLRIINVIQLFRKAALFAIGTPYWDAGFAHDFSDDDLGFRMRRMGYKAIVAGDTWIHHDHVRTAVSVDEAKKYSRNLALGREDFKEKYFGIDAWADSNNYITFKNKIKNTQAEVPQILGIDVKCGMPILDIKNTIRGFGKLSSECFAITTDPKYFIDLQTFCGAENVLCGDIIHLLDRFIPCSLDYIVIDRAINSYHNAFEIIAKAAALIKRDGHIYVNLINTNDVKAYLKMLGYMKEESTDEFVFNCSYDSFVNKIEQMGGKIKNICIECYSNEEISSIVSTSDQSMNVTFSKNCDAQDLLKKLMTRKWTFDITVE